MTYQEWIFRNGGLYVQQFSGNWPAEELFAVMESGFNSRSSLRRGPLLNLIDISTIRVPSITAEEEEVLAFFEPIRKNVQRWGGLKTAFYVESMNYEDFKKLRVFVDNVRGANVSLVPFNFLPRAMTWLGLTPTEMEEITDLLQPK